MSGYIATFHHVCMRIPNLHDLEMLDHFVRGLKPSLFERVMEQAPKTFQDATHLAERANLAQYFVQHQYRTFGDSVPY